MPTSRAEVSELRGWIADGGMRPAAALRARVVLPCAQGFGPSAVALQPGCTKQTVITWRERCRTEGPGGLRDAPRSGRPRRVNPAAVVVRTLETPEPAAARWSTRTLGVDLGISNVAVAIIWRQWGVRPLGAGRWC